MGLHTRGKVIACAVEEGEMFDYKQKFEHAGRGPNCPHCLQKDGHIAVLEYRIAMLCFHIDAAHLALGDDAAFKVQMELKKLIKSFEDDKKLPPDQLYDEAVENSLGGNSRFPGGMWRGDK